MIKEINANGLKKLLLLKEHEIEDLDDLPRKKN